MDEAVPIGHVDLFFDDVEYRTISIVRVAYI